MLLATKLHIPVRQHDLVARPRLLDKLHAGLQSRLIILSTPPGFGKTTLLTQWIDTLRSDPLGADDTPAVAWLALDEGDNDPARFFAYLAAAMQSLCPGRQSAGSDDLQPADTERLMTELINAVTASPGRKLLVLDDYHVLHSPAVHQAIVFLIEHMPANLHLVISTRADPPLPRARWRARGDLAELREADLRFREDEVREFLTAIMGIALTAQEIATLEACTEGWIAGLQLAALSMQGADDLSRRVQRFAGTHAFIGDYLTEEVLQRQSPEVQQFLLDTSILRRMCGDLCHAVTGRADSAAVLAALDRGHLFLIPLDEERVWYRYHHLFAEMLRSRAQRTPVRELHHRAAEWYLHNDSIGEAISHALAADPAWAAELLERHCRLFQERGEYITLAGWLQQMPDAVFGDRPQLCLLRAKTHMYLHEIAEAEVWLARTRQVLRVTSGLDPDAAILTATIIVQCDIALNRCELETAVDLAQQALALIPPTQIRARGETLMLLGVAYFWRSELAAAHAAWVEAGNMASAGGDMLMTVYARGNAARALYQQGRLHAAAAELQTIQQDAARRDGMDLPLYAGCHGALAELYCEWGQLESAHRHVVTALALARQARNQRTLLQAHVYALRILWAQDRLAEAAEMAAEAGELIRQVHLPPRIIEAVTYAAVRVAIVRGDEAAVNAWLAGPEGAATSPTQTPAPGEEHLHLLLARVWVARHAYAPALDLLARLQTEVEARQMGRLALETRVCRAAALAATGAHADAAQTLTAALTYARPEGFMRLFVEEGEVLRTLLAGLLPQLADDGLRAYATRILHAFPSASEPSTSGAVLPAGSQVPISLSARELEVLRLVDRGLSDRAVADQLVVVTGTVKRHLGNIYDKLGVRSRTQALARARALGWL